MGFQIGVGNDEVIPRGLKWHEIQSEQLRSGADPDTDIGLLPGNRPGHFKV